MPEEFRVIGPPGCGKTTYVKTQVESAVSKHGSSCVLLASLTKAAAAELAGRDLPVPKEAIGTIHAHAYRSIGRQEIAQSPKLIGAWNDDPERVELWPMSGDEIEAEDGIVANTTGKLPGDVALHGYCKYRSEMYPRQLWSPDIQHFAKEWEAFKAETNSIDFTDMIELAIEQAPKAPRNPAFLFLDEAQDVDRLQFRLIRQWAEHAVMLIVVGDPYQNLYQWRGTSPDTMLTPELAPDHMRVLRQSYRVPRAVHKVASNWIKRHKGYHHFEYQPRPFEGEVRHITSDYKHPDGLIEDIEQYLRSDKTVMILASCAPALWPTLTALKDAGIPFHNPMRVKNGAWNLFRHKDKILDYLQTDEETFGDHAGLWTWSQLNNWIQDFETKGLLYHGAKAKIKACTKNPDLKHARISSAVLDEIFLPDACEVNNLAWYRDSRRAAAKEMAASEYILNVAEKRGKQALRKPPRVIVGTIHSVKGGEADVVYLFPTLSGYALQPWVDEEEPEYSAIVRQFYVGITRAREELVICDQVRSHRNGIDCSEFQ